MDPLAVFMITLSSTAVVFAVISSVAVLIVSNKK